MATITSLGANDSGSVSRGVINTNFTNLNTDKIEASSTNTLTNKTINADNNTISNLEVDNIKTASKTGLDTKLATGTAGLVNELAMWNTDGDVVSSLKTVSTTAPDVDSTDDTIPTSQAVYEAIGANQVKEIFVPAVRSTDAQTYITTVSNYPVVSLDNGDDVWFVFHAPDNLTSITSVELVMIPDATETVQMDIAVNASNSGESPTIHTTTISNTTLAVTASQMTKWRIDNLAGTPYLPVTAGDIVTTEINSDTTVIRAIGLIVKYI